jgi:hypothetical protein
VRLRNPKLSRDLSFAEFETACHDGNQDDGSIEDMLNSYPYPDTDPEGATVAVRTIFGVGRTGRARNGGAGDPG